MDDDIKKRFSDNHKEALWRILKIKEDVEKTLNAMGREDFKTAFGFYNKIRESVRLIAVEGNMKDSDTDVIDRARAL